MDNNTLNANTQPEENGAKRLFTQEDVNRIVSKRLEQDRRKRNAEFEALTKRKAEEFTIEQLLSILSSKINAGDAEKRSSPVDLSEYRMKIDKKVNV